MRTKQIVCIVNVVDNCDGIGKKKSIFNNNFLKSLQEY